jgi:hypothetical protein
VIWHETELFGRQEPKIESAMRINPLLCAFLAVLLLAVLPEKFVGEAGKLLTV